MAARNRNEEGYVSEDLIIRDVRILPGQFRNFEGRPTRFQKRGGVRSFNIEVPIDMVEKLEMERWNIKWLTPREGFDGDDTPIMEVAVSYEPYPPKIVLIGGNQKTILNEDQVKILDSAEIEKADLTIRPYNWDVDGKVGVKAYCKVLYVTIVQDEFEAEYAAIPFSN